jgi:hypothetical protein
MYILWQNLSIADLPPHAATADRKPVEGRVPGLRSGIAEQHPLFLLETQRFDRMKQGGLSRRIKPEKDSDRTGKGKSQENSFYR